MTLTNTVVFMDLHILVGESNNLNLILVVYSRRMCPSSIHRWSMGELGRVYRGEMEKWNFERLQQRVWYWFEMEGEEM